MASEWQKRFGRPKAEPANEWVDAWGSHELVADACRAIGFAWKGEEEPEIAISDDIKDEAHARIRSLLQVEEAAERIKNSVQGRTGSVKRTKDVKKPLVVKNAMPVKKAVPLKKAVVPSMLQRPPKACTQPKVERKSKVHEGSKPRKSKDLMQMERQDAKISRQLAHEIARVEALEAAIKQRSMAKSTLQRVWANWIDIVHWNRTMYHQACKYHAWTLSRRVFEHWFQYTRFQLRTRHESYQLALQHQKQLSEALAVQHYAYRTYLRVFAHWSAFIVRLKRENAQQATASERRLLAEELLSCAFKPPRHCHQSTSPTLPRDHVQTRLIQAWQEALEPSPIKVDNCKATSPPPPRQKKKIRRMKPPALITDMHARMAERKARWDVLQEKYKQRQLQAQEEEKALREAQAAAEEKQKKLAIEHKRQLKREQERKEQEKQREKEIYRHLWALAKQHDIRASVYWRGFDPWKRVYAASKQSMIKACNHHCDYLLFHSFTAWKEFLALQHREKQRQEDEACEDAQWYYKYRLQQRLLALWKQAWMDTRLKMKTVSDQHDYYLVAAAWREMHARALKRSKEYGKALTRIQQLKLLHMVQTWRAQVAVWRHEAHLHAEKQAMWAKVHEWLQDAK